MLNDGIEPEEGFLPIEDVELELRRGRVGPDLDLGVANQAERRQLSYGFGYRLGVPPPKIYSHANLDVMRKALGKLDGRLS